MFWRMRGAEPKPLPAEHLHEWVKQADLKARYWRSNPDRPNVMALEGKTLKAIEECTREKLVRGDAVAMTFRVSYVVGKNDWYPTYALLELIRVAVPGSDAEAAEPEEDEDVEVVQLDAPARLALRQGEMLEGALCMCGSHVRSD